MKKTKQFYKPYFGKGKCFVKLGKKNERVATWVETRCRKNCRCHFGIPNSLDVVSWNTEYFCSAGKTERVLNTSNKLQLMYVFHEVIE